MLTISSKRRFSSSIKVVEAQKLQSTCLRWWGSAYGSLCFRIRLGRGKEHGQKYTLQQQPSQLGKDISATTTEPKFLYTRSVSHLNLATRKSTIMFLKVSSATSTHYLGSSVPTSLLPTFTLMILLCMQLFSLNNPKSLMTGDRAWIMNRKALRSCLQGA